MNIYERMFKTRIDIRVLIKWMSLILAVGYVGFLIPYTRPLFARMTPLIVILGALILVWFQNGNNKRFYAWSSIIISLGFFVEVLGVNTGLIFGEYTYGNVLGIKLWGTPLLLGVNWFVVTYSSIGAIEELDTPMWIRIPLTGVLITAFDIVLEPIAIGLGMWSWSAESVPIQNYFAWFLIGVIFTGLYHLFGLKAYNMSAGPVYLSMFMFFLFLNLIFLF